MQADGTGRDPGERLPSSLSVQLQPEQKMSPASDDAAGDGVLGEHLEREREHIKLSELRLREAGQKLKDLNLNISNTRIVLYSLY